MFEVKDVFCFGVCLRKSARSAGDFGGYLYKLIEYSCVFILPQITQITQMNTAKLYYFAEKDRLFEVKAVLLFWGLSA